MNGYEAGSAVIALRRLLTPTTLCWSPLSPPVAERGKKTFFALFPACGKEGKLSG